MHGEALESVHGEALESVHGEALESVHGEALELVHGEALESVHGELRRIHAAHKHASQKKIGSGVQNIYQINLAKG